MIGKTISHYKILEKLGEGGMGIVYKAEDTKLDRIVALKFLYERVTDTLNDEARERFKREAQAAAALNHPNIITVHEINEFEGKLYIVTEYIEGENLLEKIKPDQLSTLEKLEPRELMPIRDVIGIAIQICEGLKIAHESNIIHRDIKPQNILINKGGIVKILDFGLAKLKGVSKLTKESQTLGTIAYMSPEQTQGEEIDIRSDIWSIGITLYEMVTGQLPFIGEYPQAIQYSILNEEPKLVTELRDAIPLGLAQIVKKMLEKDINARYQNVEELLYELKSLSKKTFAIKESVPLPKIKAGDLEKKGFIKQKGEKEKIKDYKLLELIGEGGVGTVYLAQQHKPVRRKVAIKLIKPGMDTKEVIARFESERQALAMMNHPNIAQVYDAGETRNGQPYFVMEYVPGFSITEYCDKKKLSTQERLELFQKVCDGIQHAHYKGIVHRDLKPTNVIVTYQDEKHVPKVIDFGIAKSLTGQGLTDKTMHTKHGVAIGTPVYMSPEQAELSGYDIDTRTDIYSLGVLLYELLVGVTPFEKKDLEKAGLIEMLRIIREDQIPTPSTKFNSLGETSTEIAKKRGTSEVVIQRQLKGDLDWIVMKSLDKDRRRRYNSASDFASDLKRYLNKEPIQARPPSLIYKLSKYVKKNKVASFFILFIMIMSLKYTIDLRQERKLALQARDEATNVVKFIVDLFEVSDPSEALGKKITAREILNKGAKEIAQGLQEQPLTRARLMDTIGTIFMKLGLYEDSEALLRKALELREELLDDKDLQVAESLASLSLLLELRGDFREAEQIAVRALYIRERTLPPDHPDIAASLHGLAHIYYRQVKLKKSEPFYKRSLEIRRKAFGSSHAKVAESLNCLGVLYFAQGQYDEAEKCYHQALTIREEVLGPDHPAVGSSLNSLATLYLKQHRFDETEPLYRRALAIREITLGPIHPAVATSLNNIAILFYYQGNLTEAEKYYQRALKIRQQSLLENHPDIAQSLMNLAIIYQEMGNLQKSKSFYEQSLTVMEKAYGQDNSEVAKLLNNLALLYIDLGDNINAEKLLKRALKIMEKAFGPNHIQVTQSLDYLGYLYAITKRYNEAEQVYTRALSIKEKKLGPDNSALADVLNSLGHVLNKQSKYAKAEEQLLRALDICEKNPKANILYAKATSLHNLGSVNFHGLNRYDKAESFFKRAVVLQEKVYGTDSKEIKETIKEYADLLLVLDRKKEAEALEKKLR